MSGNFTKILHILNDCCLFNLLPNCLKNVSLAIALIKILNEIE